jgi:pSer/pThr/pTyr-binding forkhead associated (FHA) protein
MSNNIKNNVQDANQELVLSQGKVTIGRAEDNTVILDDSSVSAYHAIITTLFKASYIEDLGSTNGTFVNGKRIIKHTLHDGDTVTIGEQRIKVSKSEQITAA